MTYGGTSDITRDIEEFLHQWVLVSNKQQKKKGENVKDNI